MNDPTKPLSFTNTEEIFSSFSNADLKRKLLLFKAIHSPLLTKIGTSVTTFSMKLGLPISWAIKPTIFRQFCGGETLDETQHVIDELAEQGIDSILDYGVEAKESEAEYDNAMYEHCQSIAFAAKNDHVRSISCKITGLARFGLLEKIHARQPLTEAENEEYKRLGERVDTISQKAYETGVQVFYDAEETWIQHPIDALVNQMMRHYNQERAIIFNTHQLYRKDRLSYLKDCIDEAKNTGYILGAKLVRGAYMEKERQRAKRLGYTSPICDSKEETDQSYDQGLQACIEHFESVTTVVATHNEKSCQLAAQLIDKNNMNRDNPRVFFSQLYGMAAHLTVNLAKEGYNATKYIPFGPVKEVIPYLIRRAEENSSVSGQLGRELSLVKEEMARRGL